MDSLETRIIKTLKAGWKAKGWTYKSAGERFGLSESSMQKKLNGEQKVSLGEAVAFAQKFGITISAKLK